MPIAIDLFSGCGGLTLGLKKAGFRVVGAVDIDPLSVETYKANHREVAVWEKDIRTLNPTKVMRELNLEKGTLDLLAGCPPCQGFSSIRTLNGSRKVIDSRNDLLNDFLRFIEDMQPKAVMLENVPGLADDKRFNTFCDRLAEIGYRVDHRILDASDYGVPQRRRRLILLAGRGRRISFAVASRRRKTVHHAIASMPPAGKSGDPMHDISEKRTRRIQNLIKKIPKNGGSRTDLPKRKQLKCHKKCDGFKDVYGRMAWDDVSPTITSGCFNPSKGRFLHPIKNRAITMREAALLQGFPRKYKFPNVKSKSAIALLIGNALPPPFVAAHAKRVHKVLRKS